MPADRDTFNDEVIGCICDWPEDCGGTGWVECEGCGGDSCVCAACNGAGEGPCPGCDYDPSDDDDLDDPDPDDPDDCLDCGICDDCIERTRAYFEDREPEPSDDGRGTA